MALNVKQAITDIMLLWGIENPDASASATRARAMLDLNKSVQLLWANAEKLDYFNQQPITQTLVANTASLVLESGIQNIIGPVRIAATGAVLNPIKTRDDLENFGPYYLGQDTVLQGAPFAYYLQRSFQSDADCLALSIFPVPVPLINTAIKLDVVMDCPSYTYTDYCNSTVIPVPHAYGELILLPLMRHSAMSHSLFCVPTRAPLIEAEYVEARKALGLVAPEVDEIQPEMAPIVNAPWNQRRDR